MDPPTATRPAKSSVVVGEATVVVVVVLVLDGEVAVLSSHPAHTSARATSRTPVTASGRRVSILDVTSWGQGGLARPDLQAARPRDLMER